MAFTVSNGVITQTGRDTNLSGLNGLAGVTVTQEGRLQNVNINYYDLGTNRLIIQGTLFHDPETEVMIFHNTEAKVTITVNASASWKNIVSWSKDADGYLVLTYTAHGLLEGDSLEIRSIYTGNVDGILKRIHRVRSVTPDTITLDNSTEWDIPPLSGQFTKRACYNFGKEITVNGRTRTSRATGLYLTGWSTAVSNWDPITSTGIKLESGYFYGRGGTIHTARPLTAGYGGVDIKDTVLVALQPRFSSYDYTIEFREFSGKGFVRNLGLVNLDMNNYRSLDVVEFSLLDSALIESLGDYYEVSLNNLDTTTNVSETDIGPDATQIFSHRYYKLNNSKLGSNIRSMWRGVRGSSGQYNALESHRIVKPTLLDTNNAPVSSAKIYVKDTPSLSARIGYLPNSQTQYKNGFIKLTNTTPPVATMLNHGFSTGDIIAIYGFSSVSGIANADPVNGRRKVTVIDADTFTLQNPDGTDVIGQQTFDLTSISEGITAITNNGGRTQLTVPSDWTASLIASSTNSSASDRIYIKGIVGGADLEALNNRLHSIYAITSTTITLNTSWPSTLNTYTGGGTFHKVYKDSYNTTTAYDYRPTRVYTGTTDSSGTIVPMDILIATQLHEYNPQEAVALIAYGGIYDMDYNSVGGWSWKHKGTNVAPAYTDWDTDRFGGFYKVDRRGVGNSASDIFDFKFCHYNKLLTSYSPSLTGTDTLNFSWVMFDDTLITADRATADGYTELNTPQAFYNRAKAYLVDNYAGESATIVSREGTTINAGSYNVTLDATAAEVFAFDGSTITLKSTSFVGNITGSGTFTLLNGAEVLGTFGGTTVYPWEVRNVEAGSTLQLFNITQNLEIENLVVSGTAGTKVTATGTYATSEATPGDTIRLRVTYQGGVTALLPFETNGVATSAGLSLRADQEADTVYNSNNIDGSSISGISLTPDYSNIQIDLDDQDAPYEISAQAIYNYYAYLVTTSQGIANFYGAITPIDRLNYRINASVVPLKLQNTGSTDVVLNGGRLYRDDNVSVIDTGAGAGTGSLMQDTGMLIQYLQPQVVSALGAYGVATASALSDTESILKKKITQAALI